MTEKLRPMLAGKAPKDLTKLKYPLWASVKLDGIRCLIVDGEPVSRTLKPIPNAYIRECLSHADLDTLDGELIVGSPTDPNCMQKTTSGVMSRDGEPDFKFYAFDSWKREGLFSDFYRDGCHQLCGHPYVTAHEHRLIHDPNELQAMEKAALAEGYEGLILRHVMAPYKYGRSTTGEQYMLKLKRFEDAEATVVGVEELLHNDNEATFDERGYTKRSLHKDNRRPMGTLGALICQTNNNDQFRIGTGFTRSQRDELWKSRQALPGRIAKYKHFTVGRKNLPRHPVFLGFRDPIDTE